MATADTRASYVQPGGSGIPTCTVPCIAVIDAQAQADCPAPIRPPGLRFAITIPTTPASASTATLKTPTTPRPRTSTPSFAGGARPRAIARRDDPLAIRCGLQKVNQQRQTGARVTRLRRLRQEVRTSRQAGEYRPRLPALMTRSRSRVAAGESHRPREAEHDQEKQGGYEPERRNLIHVEYEQASDQSAEQHRDDGEAAPADPRSVAAGRRESEAMPVRVRVSTVVVRSGTASFRAAAFWIPIPAPRSAMSE